MPLGLHFGARLAQCLRLPDSVLKFHKAYNPITKQANEPVSAAMMAAYPAAVRERLGTLTRNYKVLTGSELIRLGDPRMRQAATAARHGRARQARPRSGGKPAVQRLRRPGRRADAAIGRADGRRGQGGQRQSSERQGRAVGRKLGKGRDRRARPRRRSAPPPRPAALAAPKPDEALQLQEAKAQQRTWRKPK